MCIAYQPVWVYYLQLALITLLTINTQGCATAELQTDVSAKKFGFIKEKANSTKFRHTLYRNFVEKRSFNRMHIYLEGDGTPWQNWITGRLPARNPRVKNPLALTLMSLDEQPSVYISRPCYQNTGQDKYCNALLWTQARYSRSVVSALADIIMQLNQRYTPKQICLIGYSGGGTLATLLTQKFQSTEIPVRCLLTVAANLNLKAWTRHHGYNDLDMSLNPYEQDAINTNITQVHLAAKKDINVPVKIIHSFVEKQSNARLILYDQYDHYCCWQQEWKSVLKLLENTP